MKLICAVFLLICGLTVITKGQQNSLNDEKTVYVVGNVAKPSKLTFREEMTVTQAIKEVGGISPDKKRSVVFVYRLKPNSKDREIIKIELKAIQKKQVENFGLQSLDIVEVRLSKKRNIGDVFTLVSKEPSTFYKFLF